MQMTNDEIWAELSKVYNLPNLPEEATEIIGDLMLSLHESELPEQNHGEWIDRKLVYSDLSIATCSRCKKRVPVGNYCNNCGSYNM